MKMDITYGYDIKGAMILVEWHNTVKRFKM